jgi:putative ABC transport system permease protein
MAIPIAYNLRNLTVRKGTTLMTALGIALTVAVLLAVLALVSGLRSAFESTGNPLNVIVVRKSANSELVSGMTREQYQDLKFKPGIAKSASGEPLTSLEMVTVINLPSTDNEGGFNVNLRGVEPNGIALRDNLKIGEGRWFQAGQREVVVGKAIAERHPTARLGRQLRFGKGQWTVVGVMDGGKSAVNSEIYGDLNQISSDFNRADGLSSALVRAVDLSSVSALVNSIKDDVRLNEDAIPEKEYYDRQTSAGAPLQAMGIFVSLIMAIGSCFAAMNTMYAAVARRGKEIGTLRVLGFSRTSILFSFFLESLLLSVIGGFLGVLLVLPLNNVTTGITSFFTFSEIAFNFRVSPAVVLTGLVFALFMGALGGFFPARSAARKEILTALRDI